MNQDIETELWDAFIVSTNKPGATAEPGSFEKGLDTGTHKRTSIRSLTQ